MVSRRQPRPSPPVYPDQNRDSYRFASTALESSLSPAEWDVNQFNDETTVGSRRESAELDFGATLPPSQSQSEFGPPSQGGSETDG